MSKLAWLVVTIGGAVLFLAACSSQPTPTMPALTSSTAALPTSAPSATPSTSNTNTRPVPSATPSVVPSATATGTVDLAPRLIRTLGQGMITGPFRSPDGKFILYAVGGELHYVDARTQAELGVLELSDNNSVSILGIHFSSDGRLAAIVPGVSGLSIPIVRLADRHIISTMLSYEFGNDVVFTSDDHFAVATGSSMATGVGEGVVEVWDLTNDRLASNPAVPTQDIISQDYSPPVLSPNGRLVAAGADNNIVYVWTVSDGRLFRSFRGHTARVTAVAFSPDGNLLVSGSDDGTIRIWDVPSGQQKRSVATGLKSSIVNITFSQDGGQIHIVYDYGPELYWTLSLATGRLDAEPAAEATVDPFATVLYQRGYIQGDGIGTENTIAFNPDGRSVALGGLTILLWPRDGNEPPDILDDRSGPIFQMAYSSDGHRLAVYSDPTRLQVWDVAAGRVVFSTTEQTQANFAISPDGQLVAQAHGNVVEIWKIGPVSRVSSIQLSSANGPDAVAFSADGRQLDTISNDYNTIQVWDVATGTMMHQVDLPTRGYAQPGSALHWPLYVRQNGDQGNWVEIWNLDDQRMLKLEEGHGNFETLALSADGRLLIASQTHHWYFWRTDTGQPLYDAWQPALEDLAGLAISPDGNTLAVGQSGQAVLWDISSIHAAALLPPSTQVASPTAVTVSP